MRGSPPLRSFIKPLRRLLRRFVGSKKDGPAISGKYKLLKGEVAPSLQRGFAVSEVAERQHRAIAPLLAQLRAGRARRDFLALAEAVQTTGLEDPLIVEVGCGSGWNAEVLARLMRRQVRYVGMDYSFSMLRIGRDSYPGLPFVLGDAIVLPFRTGAVDICVSGTVLMHLVGYSAAIDESRRVARKWCIFHTVPVLRDRSTTFLRKEAYGHETVEVIFNETELSELFRQHKLVTRHMIDSIPYDLELVVGEETVTRTYVCEVEV